MWSLRSLTRTAPSPSALEGPPGKSVPLTSWPPPGGERAWPPSLSVRAARGGPGVVARPASPGRTSPAGRAAQEDWPLCSCLRSALPAGSWGERVGGGESDRQTGRAAPTSGSPRARTPPPSETVLVSAELRECGGQPPSPKSLRMFWEREAGAGPGERERQRAGTRQGGPEQEFGAGDAAAGRGCICGIPAGDTRGGRSTETGDGRCWGGGVNRLSPGTPGPGGEAPPWLSRADTWPPRAGLRAKIPPAPGPKT